MWNYKESPALQTSIVMDSGIVKAAIVQASPDQTNSFPTLIKRISIPPAQPRRIRTFPSRIIIAMAQEHVWTENVKEPLDQSKIVLTTPPKEKSVQQTHQILHSNTEIINVMGWEHVPVRVNAPE